MPMGPWSYPPPQLTRQFEGSKLEFEYLSHMKAIDLDLACTKTKTEFLYRVQKVSVLNSETETHPGTIVKPFQVPLHSGDPTP